MTYMMTTRTTVSTASFTLPGPSSITTLVTLKDDVKHLRTDVDDQLRLWRGDVDDALVHERHRYTSGLAQVRAESNQEMMGIKSQLAMLKSRCDTLESEVKVLRRTSQECLNAPGPHVLQPRNGIHGNSMCSSRILPVPESAKRTLPSPISPIFRVSRRDGPKHDLGGPSPAHTLTSRRVKAEPDDHHSLPPSPYRHQSRLSETSRASMMDVDVEAALNWDHDDYSSLKRFVHYLVEKHLDVHQDYAKQKNEALRTIHKLTLQHFPKLAQYNPCWPIMQLVKAELPK